MQKGYAKLRPLDAVHLASAAIANADEMHTFDTALLGLDGKITKADGTLLKICKPSLGGQPLPLLESGGTTDAADDTDEHESEESEGVPPPEGVPSISGGSEGVGLLRGRGGVRPVPVTDSDDPAGAEAPTEEVRDNDDAKEELGQAIEGVFAGIQQHLDQEEVAANPLANPAAPDPQLPKPD